MQLDAGWGAVTAIAEGDGDGEPLAVLLHAAGSSPRALGAMAQALRGAEGRSIAPALPMSLDAASPPIRRLLSRQIAVARAALGHGAPGRRILFGHSFGGLVALLALLDGAAADAVILYEPIVLAALDPTDSGDRAARAWDRALIDHLGAGVAAGDPEPGVARFIEAYNEVAWPKLPPAARAAILGQAASLVALTRLVHHLEIDRDAIRRLTTPVLVLSGDRSPDIAQRMAVRLARLLPNVAQTVVPGAGHMGPVMAADRVMAAIRPHLDAVLNPGAAPS